MKFINYFSIFIILLTIVSCSQAQVHEEDQLSQLNTKQSSIVPIAAFAANGDLTSLKNSLNAGLDAGLTINEIKEVLVHLYAYAGFPRSIRGLQTFMEVLDERKTRGITDKLGSEASPVNDSRSKYDRGKGNLEELIGMPLTGPQKGYAAFAPVIEIFLKEHLFADLFDRDVLTYTEREIVTVSVLITLGELEPMMRSHMNICLNLGLTGEQLSHLVSIIEEKVGKKQADAARPVLDEILKGN